MRDILDRVERWLAGGEQVALATVIATERAAPRGPGAVLAVTEDLEVAGSVTGGCVEAAVIEEAREVTQTGRPKRLAYRITGDDARAVGFSCGGTVHLFVERARSDLLSALGQAIRSAVPVALVTEVTGPRPGAKMLLLPRRILGSLEDFRFEDEVVTDAQVMLERAETGLHRYGLSGEVGGDDMEVFIESFAAPPRTYVFGATTHAATVTRPGEVLGYRVTVCDARGVFATPERIPDADERVVREPHAFLAAARLDRRTLTMASNAQSVLRSRCEVNPPTERTETPGGRRTA